jgi:hypothetical protein
MMTATSANLDGHRPVVLPVRAAISIIIGSLP